jgi:hypothetical protein
VSCGYKFGHGSMSEQYHTISVPYVKGDHSGIFTAELIKQISHSGAFKYRNSNAELTMKAVIHDYHDENIGFQFDKDADGNRISKLVPTERRVKVLVEVSLIEALTGNIVLGPKFFTAEADYDFDPDITRDNIAGFSLGQLNSTDEAKEVALNPLNQSLSKKIVDYITNTWE